jgi:hypothetical protein
MVWFFVTVMVPLFAPLLLVPRSLALRSCSAAARILPIKAAGG